MRRKRNVKRDISGDVKYGNVLVEKLINYVMKEGKKSTARKIVYGAFDIVEKESKKPAIEAFEEAMRNIQPVVEVKSRRIGGANYQVPREVRGDRRVALAYRWLLDGARKKTGKPMAVKLAEELLLATKNEGNAVKKKMDTHRMAEANKAFAHFSW
ncbi:MAG: 30S ribosomal protein S7 [Candidatus Sungbacteria bacterium RIFCSPLOWO2_02_FULL_48_13b]|uniref:Small ribosomal subunit protein uS7 n=2 Tax=Candidatus Sungiibacteriota TaxID=1817917 RepID=A0A1G2LGT6_9BACT|nr:MAG: 30S ribosomal protein S7 [Candidatus Sungbacteria bacterium RIFCSPHIGHO2_02_FULL_49_20]OHA10011.1 MAG: 30S ribosomal protein S7 [Candidatus Sungbacteria bacterium RIFCSPLOWO2_02_FULL_48_13b]